MGQVHFSIIGTCVSRDIFGLHEKDGGCVLDRFVQTIHPFSIVTPSPVRGISGDKAFEEQGIYRKGWSEFYKRNFRLDVLGGVYGYLRRIKSDYLIVDFGELRHGLYQMLEGEAYLTGAWTEEVPNLVRKGLMSDRYRRIKTEELGEDLFCKYMDRYVEMLLDLYEENRIIINECYAVRSYVTSDRREKKEFSTGMADGYNRVMRKGFEYARNKMAAAHVIPFPRGVIGDESHKWGRSTLHYVKEYYDYGIKAVDIICRNQDMAQEKKELHSLSEQYGELLEDRYRI